MPYSCIKAPGKSDTHNLDVTALHYFPPNLKLVGICVATASEVQLRCSAAVTNYPTLIVPRCVSLPYSNEINKS